MPNANSDSIRAPLTNINDTDQPVQLAISTELLASNLAHEEHTHKNTEQPVSISLASDARPPLIRDDTDIFPFRHLRPPPSATFP